MSLGRHTTRGAGTADPGCGLPVDREGRIHIADCTTDRVIRIDEITGEGWTSFTGFNGPHQVIPLD